MCVQVWVYRCVWVAVGVCTGMCIQVCMGACGCVQVRCVWMPEGCVYRCVGWEVTSLLLPFQVSVGWWAGWCHLSGTRRNRVCAFSLSQLMAVVASTILDLIKNMRAFGGILVVSLAACAGPSGGWSWTVGWGARAQQEAGGLRKEGPCVRGAGDQGPGSTGRGRKPERGARGWSGWRRYLTTPLPEPEILLVTSESLLCPGPGATLRR